MAEDENEDLVTVINGEERSESAGSYNEVKSLSQSQNSYEQ